MIPHLLALEHVFPVSMAMFVPPCVIYSAIMWIMAAHDQSPMMLQTCRGILASSLQTSKQQLHHSFNQQTHGFWHDRVMAHFANGGSILDIHFGFHQVLDLV